MEATEALEAGDPRQVGRYRIVGRLGAGGMGRVYLGRSPGGRAVAVELVRPELAEDAEFRRRFAREVAAARRVNGVFTAGVVDADPDGSPAWLATAYVPGIALGEALAVHGPWAEGPVLALGAGLAEALEAIHAAGVVHLAYVGGADGGVHAVDAATGERRWVHRADSFVSGRPVVADGAVYAASRGSLYAVDAATGDQRWSFATEGTVFGPPAVVDGVVYAGSDKGTLYAVRAADGEQRWKSPDVGAAFSAPAVADGGVYAGSADGKLRAVDPAGHGRWKFATRKRGLAAPVVAGEVVCIGATDHHLYAVDAGTGASRWRFDTGAPVYSAPAVADGTAFVSSENGYLYAVAT
ncbi:PQQ-binding-like beta-propeller repeat protein [Streptomyces sp. NPDC060027]|uniref:outer membrane protein assembly factor BamB family protein n=1 Tax=Streptomyces sp. NPDC060027 TaxID=3347040 RepID=UPI0036A3CB0C